MPESTYPLIGNAGVSTVPNSARICMIEAARSGVLSIEKLEAMTAVCSVGLNMIASGGATAARARGGAVGGEVR